jgi:hypothetical protein
MYGCGRVLVGKEVYLKNTKLLLVAATWLKAELD